ncbi:MAG: hypothetical protein IJS54_03490 [Desulfovibrio sp.]|nr:hypothetical protein [Desulfovibrio sp.]
MTTISCGAKINLGLRITGKREDGYHTIDSFFYPLPHPCDTLTIAESTTPGLSLRSTIALPEDNTLRRIYQAVSQKIPLPGFHITLTKSIPVGSGLGGASSDAAAFLRYLDSFLGHPFSEHEITELATRAGADVPFFLTNKPARVQGIGDECTLATLTPLPLRLLLVSPPIFLATPKVYAQFDAKTPAITLTKQDIPLTLRLLHNQACIPWSIENDLEAPALTLCPELVTLRKSLESPRVLGLGMSGSGSSLYALYGMEDAAALQTSKASLEARGLRCFSMVLGSPD